MIITLCGSTKFKREYEEINKELTLKGHCVFSVALFGHADNINLEDEEKEMLDAVHIQKIMLSDAIYVIDVNNYVGRSTRREIAFAQANNKKIYYLGDDV